jgi:cell division protein FtsB
MEAMESEKSDNQPENSTPEIQEPLKTPLQPESVKDSPKVEKPQLSGPRRIFRKVLFWAGLLAIIFLAGITTDHFLRLNPLQETIAGLQASLDQATQEADSLQSKNDQLTAADKISKDRITSLEGDKKDLLAEIEATNAHLALMKILVDVSNARVALFLGDVEGAKDVLINTQQRLDDLSSLIAEVDSNLAADIPQRFNLIISGLERDTETVNIDLELITKDLLEIEAALFNDN